VWKAIFEAVQVVLRAIREGRVIPPACVHQACHPLLWCYDGRALTCHSIPCERIIYHTAHCMPPLVWCGATVRYDGRAGRGRRLAQ
jgi:hypothetical protein